MCIVAASTLSSLVVVCYSSLSGVICTHEILEEVVIGHALLMQHYKLLYKRHFPLSSFGYVDNVKGFIMQIYTVPELRFCTWHQKTTSKARHMLPQQVDVLMLRFIKSPIMSYVPLVTNIQEGSLSLIYLVCMF